MFGKAMTVGSPKGSPRVATFPRSLSNIAVSVGGLAVFLILASLLLVSSPIGSTVNGYFSDIDVSNSLVMPVVRRNSSSIDSQRDGNVGLSEKDSRSGSDLGLLVSSSSGNDESINPLHKESSSSRPSVELATFNTKRAANGVPKAKDGSLEPKESDIENKGSDETGLTSSLNSEPEANLDVSGAVSNATKTTSNDADCDLYHGSWFYDPLGPTYTNNSCPVITQMQNCQGNGRPDKEYENWRWKPSQCELPRFDAKKFLELMRGKTLAFVGDSVARNQMESMLCLLWQVEVPKNRGNKKMQRYYFRSTSTMIVRIWSSWLVHQSTEALDFAPKGIDKIHLDVPHEVFMDHIATFDVVVISSGHWFAKRSAYIVNNEIVGGQLWWPDQSREMKVNNIEAFGISVETALTAMATHPNYTGITIVRSYSPDHYENGAWNTGGSCTGKIKPLASGELVLNEFTEIMHQKQVAGFDRALKRATDKSRLKLMDVTEVFGYRHDGHPGPFRSPDPNKLTKRGPDGRPPPQDCLHWCMPGPVDTWNELVLEIIRREFEGRGSSSS